MSNGVYAIQKYVYAQIKEIGICQHRENLGSLWKKQEEIILLFSSKSSVNL